MKHKTLLFSLIISSFALGACAPSVTSSSSFSEASSSSSFSEPSSSLSSSSESSSEASSSIVKPSINKEFLDSLSGSVTFDGSYQVIYYDSGATPYSFSYITGFIGESSYSFKAEDDNYTSIDLHLYKEEDSGYTRSASINISNEVITNLLVDESGDYVLFDEVYFNPIKNLDVDTSASTYLLPEEEAKEFAQALDHYGLGDDLEVFLYREGDGLGVQISYTTSDRYGNSLFNAFDVVVEAAPYIDIPELTPYETEYYHKEIEEALSAWDSALGGEGDKTGYTYEKTRHDLHFGLEDVTVYSTITSEATLFKNDGGITSIYDYGYALFDDGNYYEFTIKDEAVEVGDRLTEDYWTPNPGVVAAEMFTETVEEDVYDLRDDCYATEVVLNFLEACDDRYLIRDYFGAVDVSITLNDSGAIDSFTYTSYMYDYTGGTYDEQVTTKILDLDTATIDYDFVL